MKESIQKTEREAFLMLSEVFDKLEEFGEARGSAPLSSDEKELLTKVATGSGTKEEIVNATLLASENRKALELLAKFLAD